MDVLCAANAQNGRVGLRAQIWWSQKCICASIRCKAPSASHSGARQRQLWLLCSARLGNCLTCFKSPIALRFEPSENVAIHLYSSIMSAGAYPRRKGRAWVQGQQLPCMPGCVACGTCMGLKFTMLYLRMCILYRLKAKELSRTQ